MMLYQTEYGDVNSSVPLVVVTCEELIGKKYSEIEFDIRGEKIKAGDIFGWFTLNDETETLFIHLPKKTGIHKKIPRKHRIELSAIYIELFTTLRINDILGYQVQVSAIRDVKKQLSAIRWIPIMLGCDENDDTHKPYVINKQITTPIVADAISLATGEHSRYTFLVEELIGS